MAEREARVRLSLVAGGYLGGLQQVGQQTHSLTSKLKSGWADFGKQAGASILNLTKQVAGLAATAAGIGGAFSAAGALRGAVQMQSTYRDLAFAMSRATGKAVEWTKVQREVESAAAATGRTSEELADAFKSVLAETGDADLAGKSMKAIGTLATASGRSVSELSSVAGALNDKLGVTAAEMPDALSAALDLANKGGIGFEDLTKAIHLTGASARAAGMTGTEAFSQLVAMMNKGGDALGSTKKGLSAIVQVMDQMADPGKQKALKVAFGVDVKDKGGNLKDTQKILGEIFSKTGGKREALAKVFGGEQLKLVTELGKPFREAFEKTGGDLKTKTAAGLEAFNDSMKAAGKSGFSFAQAQEEAKKRMEDDPMRKLAKAAETWNQAFAKPEIIAGMNSLATSVPRLATGAASVVAFFTANPFKGLGLVVAGAVAKDIAAAKIGEIIKGALTGGGGGGTGAGALGAGAGVGAGAGLAFGAAALGVGLAAHQGSGLLKDIGSKRSLLDAILPGFEGGEFVGGKDPTKLLTGQIKGVGGIVSDVTRALINPDRGSRGGSFMGGTDEAGLYGQSFGGKGRRAGPLDAHMPAEHARKAALDSLQAPKLDAAGDKHSTAAAQLAAAAKELSGAAKELKTRPGGGNYGPPPPSNPDPGFTPR